MRRKRSDAGIPRKHRWTQSELGKQLHNIPKQVARELSAKQIREATILSHIPANGVCPCCNEGGKYCSRNWVVQKDVDRFLIVVCRSCWLSNKNQWARKRLLRRAREVQEKRLAEQAERKRRITELTRKLNLPVRRTDKLLWEV